MQRILARLDHHEFARYPGSTRLTFTSDRYVSLSVMYLNVMSRTLALIKDKYVVIVRLQLLYYQTIPKEHIGQLRVVDLQQHTLVPFFFFFFCLSNSQAVLWLHDKRWHMIWSG